MPRSIASLFLLLLAVASAVPAAEGKDSVERQLAALPGFVDAAGLGVYDREEDLTVEVTLQGPLIQFVAEAARSADPELADALSRIRSVRFRLYALPAAEVARVRRRAAASAAGLEGRGWERVVRIRQDELQSDLFLKTAGERIVGLVVLFVDAEGQYGFINLAGEIDPAQVGRIGSRFDLDVLEEAQQELSKGRGKPARSPAEEPEKRRPPSP